MLRYSIEERLSMYPEARSAVQQARIIPSAHRADMPFWLPEDKK